MISALRVEPLAPLVHGHCRELLRRLGHLSPRGCLSLAGGIAHHGIDGSGASQRAAEDGGIPRQRIECLAHERPHEGELALRNAAGRGEHVREPHGSHGNAPEVLRVLAEGGDDLGRATADVNDRPARLRRRTVQNAQADQAGLLPARDDLQGQSRALADPAGDLKAVGGLAERTGRDRADPRLIPATKRCVPAERGEQALDDLLVETPGSEHALSRPDGIALLVQRLERSVGEQPCDLEPDGVRADVDGRQHSGPPLGRHRAGTLAPSPAKSPDFGRVSGTVRPVT